jgi:hypothetical protein
MLEFLMGSSIFRLIALLSLFYTLWRIFGKLLINNDQRKALISNLANESNGYVLTIFYFSKLTFFLPLGNKDQPMEPLNGIGEVITRLDYIGSLLPNPSNHDQANALADVIRTTNTFDISSTPLIVRLLIKINVISTEFARDRHNDFLEYVINRSIRIYEESYWITRYNLALYQLSSNKNSLSAHEEVLSIGNILINRKYALPLAETRGYTRKVRMFMRTDDLVDDFIRATSEDNIFTLNFLRTREFFQNATA